MAEIKQGANPKIIAFYLPQFHQIPENDLWWGEGFTEWTNVKKAQALFEGHDQPKEPLDDRYYDLSDVETQRWQASIAKSYGIFGFCYYHYWFKGGKMLLEKPAEQMLADQTIDLPFCFSWANENWSRRWDGGNNEILMAQEYGGRKEWESHLQYLLPFFRDKRYITIDGKPLFIIYKAEQIIDIYQMASYFRKRMKEEGFPGICLLSQYPAYYSDMYYRDDVFDYRIAFEPVHSRDPKASSGPGTAKKVNLIRRIFGENALSAYRKVRQRQIAPKSTQSGHLQHYSWNQTWSTILSASWDDDLLPGAFVDWDNTPRNRNGLVYDGFSVDGFAENMHQLVSRARKEKKSMIFINAWNEWAEGAFLEPDKKNGYGKLEAILQATKSSDV